MGIYAVIVLLPVVVTVATAVLFIKTRRPAALAMLLGLIISWSGFLAAQFGSEQAPYRPEDTGAAVAAGDPAARELIRNVVLTKKPPLVAKPLLAIGMLTFSGGFLLYAIRPS